MTISEDREDEDLTVQDAAATTPQVSGDDEDEGDDDDDATQAAANEPKPAGPEESPEQAA